MNDKRSYGYYDDYITAGEPKDSKEEFESFDGLLKDLWTEGFKDEDSRKHFMDNSSKIAKMLGIKDEE